MNSTPDTCLGNFQLPSELYWRLAKPQRKDAVTFIIIESLTSKYTSWGQFRVVSFLSKLRLSELVLVLTKEPRPINRPSAKKWETISIPLIFLHLNGSRLFARLGLLYHDITASDKVDIYLWRKKSYDTIILIYCIYLSLLWACTSPLMRILIIFQSCTGIPCDDFQYILANAKLQTSTCWNSNFFGPQLYSDRP